MIKVGEAAQPNLNDCYWRKADVPRIGHPPSTLNKTMESASNE
jgi:hypothetical protein